MKRPIKVILLILASCMGALLLTVGGYVAYMSLQYYRIEDNQVLVVANPQTALLKAGSPYSVLTYNIGFGAYNHDFSFFMDSGVMKNGTAVTGTMARAQSPAIVRDNLDGAIQTAAAANADFALFQEVDEKATRSFGVNQRELLAQAFPNRAAAFGLNFHSAYLAYPFHEPHGAVQAGLLTLSSCAIQESVRRQFPVDNGFPTKFFDLDRCFVVNRLPVDNGRTLLLINCHLSAYDKGGTVRRQQLAMLNRLMSEEMALDNYVIVGGDFNHDIAGTAEHFASQQQVPAWVFSLSEEDLTKGMSIVRAANAADVPTCRSTDLPYEKGVNYTAVLDGFLVSRNVSAVSENIDTDFRFSDHNPVQCTFTLH